MPKSLPARIGRFNILKELGKGSQGIVYLAVDPQLERQVAIKTIHLRPSRDGSQQRKIMLEARTVSKLQHTNIISVYEAGEYQDNPYVVFEFVDGVSLRDLIRNNGGLAVSRAVNLMRQILDGTAYAHEQGIIHRDLSPSNVMVNKKSLDVFNLAIAKGKDLAIYDASAPRIARGLPEWYQKLLAAPAFVLCPIMVNDVCVGLVYADRDKAGEVVSANQMKYMKTLCNQAVLAMTQIRIKS